MFLLRRAKKEAKKTSGEATNKFIVALQFFFYWFRLSVFGSQNQAQ
jgi:hypothetical protein